MSKYIIAILLIFLTIMSPIDVTADEHEKYSLSGESIYYILVDRFNNAVSSNDYDINIDDPKAYHGGDLQGITKKLDYIKQLGFTAINLSPIMDNDENGYHGFSVIDFRKIDEHAGSLEDLQQLVKEANNQGLKVMIDMVVTHTGNSHDWLNEHPDWYLDQETDDTYPGGSGSPLLDLSKTEVEEALIQSALDWAEVSGIDGFRIYYDKETPDSFLERFNSRLKAEDESFLTIGHPINLNTISNEHGFDLVMDHGKNELVTSIFQRTGSDLEALYENLDNISSGLYADSHLTSRFTRAAVESGQNPITRWKLALTYLYTAPGIPILYQGTEVPMDNGLDTPDHRMAQINSADQDLKAYIEQLSSIRQQFPALSGGEYQVVDTNGAMILVKSTYEDQELYIAINNDTETKMITLDNIEDGFQLTGMLEDTIIRKQKDDTHRIVLDRETADIYILEENNGINWLFVTFLAVMFGGFVMVVILLSRKNKEQK